MALSARRLRPLRRVSLCSPAALAQAVQYLASNPAEGQAMGRRGRQYVETHFDRRVMAAQLETIFFELTRKQRT